METPSVRYNQKKTVMKEELKSIKEMLFDAPVEVKQAFNQVVEYFDDNKKFYFVVGVTNEGKVIENYYTSSPNMTNNRQAIFSAEQKYGPLKMVKVFEVGESSIKYDFSGRVKYPKEVTDYFNKLRSDLGHKSQFS